MPVMRKISIIVFLLLIALSHLGFMQVIEEREQIILQKNIDLYKEGRYKKAEQNFSLVIDRLPNSKYITTNYLMLAKSKYKLKDYTGALDIGKEFLSKFITSDYRDDMLYLMGNSYYRFKRYETAIKTWSTAITISNDTRLIEKIGFLITKTIRYRLDKSTVNRLQGELDSNDAQLLIQIALAEQDLENGLAGAANNKLKNALIEYKGSRFVSRAEKLIKTGEIEKSDMIRFALLLPLSGENENIGTSIKEGVEFALEEFTKQKNIEIELVVRDYGQDIIKALRYYKELAQNNSILAVLGPIENDISAACAALSDYERLPLISPTATEPDLTRLTDVFFQINSTIDMRAKYLAQYASDSLHISRFATFSPLDNHFLRMVETFVTNVETAGAEVVSQEWYYPGDQDFSKQFMNLKRSGLKYAFRDSILKLNPNLDLFQIDSLYNDYIEIARKDLVKSEAKLDSADIPVTSINGIFIPIYKEDLPFIAPQIAYSNILSQYLGNGDWYDLEQLKKNKNYINGIIFVTDGFINEESWDYRRFRNEYRSSLKKTPNLYNIIGYDSFKYMLSAISNVNSIIKRDEFLRRLEAIDNYTGIYRSIKLGSDKVNQNLQMLKFNYGQIIPIN